MFVQFKTRFVYLIVCCTVLLIDEVQSQCDEEMWDCDNGQCIELDEICDGQVHCQDGSDETAENCISQTCPSFAFKCTYGACIAGQHRCNGRRDCADNSDELPANCGRNNWELQLQGNCSDSAEFQCQSGECIEDDKRCDGILDCQDGSDETIEVCAGFYCPSYAFSCGYGACVLGAAKCNGLIDCADGSDEASSLCKTPRKRGNYQTTSSTATTTTKTTTINPITSLYCQIPKDRMNLIITNQKNVNLQPGDFVRQGFVLHFKCEHKHLMIGKNITYCRDGTFYNEVPTCSKFCDSNAILKGISTETLCYYMDQRRNCERGLMSGTEVLVNCAEGYRRPSAFERVFISTLRCTEEAEWDSKKTPCIMECGNLAAKVTEFSMGGVTVNITEAPWHVGIYNVFNQNTYNHICGGTIISPRIVISAAHCFWDKATDQLYDKSLFQVGAGKYYRDYYSDSEFFTVQKINISEIVVPDFKLQNYDNDLALLLLATHFKFGSSVRPICFEFYRQAEQHIPDNVQGSFAGWGISDKNVPAALLQTVTMSTLSHSSCRRRIPNDIGYELSGDKFCITSNVKANACRGDSGGGFVVKEIRNGHPFYRLVGIVSHAPVEYQDCSRDSVVVMTNIQYFEKFIFRYYNEDIAREIQ